MNVLQSCQGSQKIRKRGYHIIDPISRKLTWQKLSCGRQSPPDWSSQDNEGLLLAERKLSFYGQHLGLHGGDVVEEGDGGAGPPPLLLWLPLSAAWGMLVKHIALILTFLNLDFQGCSLPMVLILSLQASLLTFWCFKTKETVIVLSGLFTWRQRRPLQPPWQCAV